MEIIIRNSQKKIRVNISKTKDLVCGALEILKMPDESAMSVIFVSKAEIASFNKRYFKKDRPTDVIAFEYNDRRRGPYSNYLGDVIIAPDVVKENAKRFFNVFESEFNLCIVHGILHLLGYDDTKQESKKKMSKKEDYILKRLS